LRPGWTFVFKPAAGTSADEMQEVREITKCVRCALRHLAMLRRSLVAALLVGTALTLLNQGDTLLSGQWTPALYWKIPLTYCVPFLVASYGALANSRK
jgi:hypothetical protein